MSIIRTIVLAFVLFGATAYAADLFQVTNENPDDPKCKNKDVAFCVEISIDEDAIASGSFEVFNVTLTESVIQEGNATKYEVYHF